MDYPARLNQFSSVLIFVGACFNKLQLLPLPALRLVSIPISLLFYFTGYVFWFISAYLYPDYSASKDKWYGFQEFKQQTQLAAILGGVAVVFCFLSMFAPPAMLIGMWLFVAGNVVWATAEFHKYKNPPPHEIDYSTTQQKTYLKYVYLINLLSIVSAVATTVSFVFPPLALLTFTFMAITNVAIILAALNYLFDQQFGEHIPDRKINNKIIDTPEHVLTSSKHTLKKHHSLEAPMHTPLLFRARASSLPTLRLSTNDKDGDEQTMSFGIK